jgi:hypothetical protein
MATILKIIAVLTSLATTILVIVEGVKGGLIIASTIFGIVRLIVIVLFAALLLLILYSILTAQSSPKT